MTTIDRDQLQLVTGGTEDDDKDQLRAWELRHPFDRFLCGGNRRCLENGGYPDRR